MRTLILGLALSAGAIASARPLLTQERELPSISAHHRGRLAGTSALVPAQVETWYRGATAAQSLTFDDNLRGQIRMLIPMLEARGLVGTFFLVSSWLDHMSVVGTTWDDWMAVKDLGHELASHSVTHPPFPDQFNNPQGLTALSHTALVYELAHSKAKLMRGFGLDDGLVFAYPYTIHNGAVRTETANHYLAARTMSNDTVDATPADFFAIGAFGWEQGDAWPAMAVATDRALARGAWAVDMIHGCDGESWSPPACTDYGQYFDYIKSKVDAGVLWVAPFGQVVRYIKERDAASVSIAANALGVHTVSLTVNQALPPGPRWLSVSFPLPADWSGVEARDEAGALVAAATVRRSGALHAIVDVMPEEPGQVAVVTVIER